MDRRGIVVVGLVIALVIGSAIVGLCGTKQFRNKMSAQNSHSFIPNKMFKTVALHQGRLNRHTGQIRLPLYYDENGVFVTDVIVMNSVLSVVIDT